jgi:hypothetical protein
LASGEASDAVHEFITHSLSMLSLFCFACIYCRYCLCFVSLAFTVAIVFALFRLHLLSPLSWVCFAGLSLCVFVCVWSVIAALSYACRSLKSMQPDKIAMSMNDFEKAFESIEVSLGSMTGALETTTGSLVRCIPLIVKLLFGFKLT